MNQATRDIMKLLKIKEVETARQVQSGMHGAGLDFSECTRRQFNKCARDVYASMQFGMAGRKLETISSLGVAEFLEALPAPDGFTKEIYGEPIGYSLEAGTRPAVRFSNATTNDVIELHMTDLKDMFGNAGAGHTWFDTPKGRMTFDRRGVEDSFYVECSHTVEQVVAVIAEQITRIAASRARLARSTSVPQYGYNLTPERLAEHQQTLRNGGRVTLAPGGFGTGHVFSKRPSRFARPCLNDVNIYFGVGQLYVETFDHD